MAMVAYHHSELLKSLTGGVPRLLVGLVVLKESIKISVLYIGEEADTYYLQDWVLCETSVTAGQRLSTDVPECRAPNGDLRQLPMPI